MGPPEYSFRRVLPRARARARVCVCVCVCVSKYVRQQETSTLKRPRPELDCCATGKKDKVYSVTQMPMLLQLVLTPHRNFPLLI